MKDVEDKNKEICMRVRMKLMERHMSVRSMADVIGVSEPTIYKKINGGAGLTVGELFVLATKCEFDREEINFIIFG